MPDLLQKYVEVQQLAAVVEITINRPDKKNALNMAMYQVIAEAIEAADQSADVRVIIVTGTQGCFTSGNDLAVFADPTAMSTEDNPIFRFMSALSDCTKPVIAAVDGVAIGIGTTMLLHCDFVIASPTVEFKLPFVSLGLTPEYASSLLLPRLVGHVKASEWLLLGSSISAQEGLDAGLVNRICESPITAARDIAETLSQKPPKAIRQAKALLRNPTRYEVDRVIKSEAVMFAEALKGEEFAEAATAFFEKRAPDFSRFK